MRLTKRVVMIIAPVDFRDEECFEPKKILENGGIEVKVASTTKKQCFGTLGGTIIPDMTLFEVKVEEFDGIVFVGGAGAANYFYDPLAQKIALDFFRFNRIIGAICIAPVILANAGILSGKKATAWKSEERALVTKGALFTASRVEYDGNIITANGPESAEQFGRSILKGLNTMR